jgi:hypothetical protein
MPRVLTANELGTIRYAMALSEDRWPVEFRHRDGVAGVSFASSAEDAPTLVVKAVACGRSFTEKFVRAGLGEWRTLSSLPQGDCSYALTGGKVVEYGNFNVEPPDAPLENTKLAAGLQSRAPSGAVQTGVPGPADGLWVVDFTYAESSIGVSKVYLELELPTKSVECTKNEDDKGRDIFVVSENVESGLCLYRFRIVFRESTLPSSAPLSRLGYDAASSHRNGLVTWQLAVRVNDLREAGAAAGASLMDHTKGADLRHIEMTDVSCPVQSGAVLRHQTTHTAKRIVTATIAVLCFIGIACALASDTDDDAEEVSRPRIGLDGEYVDHARGQCL